VKLRRSAAITPALPEPGNTWVWVAPKNVDIVRGIYDRWARGELPWSGDALEAWDPDVEYTMPHPGLTANGRDELVRLWRRYLGTWDTYRIELDEIRPVGDDQVLAFASEYVRGKGAGVETESHHGAVWTLKDGRVVRFQSYSDRADALKAVGLSRD
jgi:ketosteroid isomerase-like protein